MIALAREIKTVHTNDSVCLRFVVCACLSAEQALVFRDAVRVIKTGRKSVFHFKHAILGNLSIRTAGLLARSARAGCLRCVRLGIVRCQHLQFLQSPEI